MRVSQVARVHLMHRYVYGYRFHADGLRLSWFLSPNRIVRGWRGRYMSMAYFYEGI
jgi:hypothetical protein